MIEKENEHLHSQIADLEIEKLNTKKRVDDLFEQIEEGQEKTKEASLLIKELEK